jgi:predicted RNA-binding protein YlxR (DUF448 family)
MPCQHLNKFGQCSKGFSNPHWCPTCSSMFDTKPEPEPIDPAITYTQRVDGKGLEYLLHDLTQSTSADVRAEGTRTKPIDKLTKIVSKFNSTCVCGNVLTEGKSVVYAVPPVLGIDGKRNGTLRIFNRLGNMEWIDEKSRNGRTHWVCLDCQVRFQKVSESLFRRTMDETDPYATNLVNVNVHTGRYYEWRMYGVATGEVTDLASLKGAAVSAVLIPIPLESLFGPPALDLWSLANCWPVITHVFADSIRPSGIVEVPERLIVKS